MGHGAKPPADSVPRTRLDAANAARVATTLQALATPSRLLILARLREGPLPATELAAEVGMEQSACSHQLRLLKQARLVVGDRSGKQIYYHLVDDHVLEIYALTKAHIEEKQHGQEN